MKPIDIYFFKEDLKNDSYDWLVEIAKIDTFNNRGIYASCESAEVPEPTNPCIVVSNYHTVYKPFLEKLHNNKINYGVIQLSDDQLKDTFEFTDSEYCKFVARNYVTPHTRFNKKVFHFGIGYANGYAKKDFATVPFSEREFAWSFAGEIRDIDDVVLARNPDAPIPPDCYTNRAWAIKSFENILFPNHIHSNDDGKYTVSEYRSIMDHTQFALCPYGTINNDTSRLYESLEAGCIPVALLNSPRELDFVPSYWHALFCPQQEDNIVPFCAKPVIPDYTKSLRDSIGVDWLEEWYITGYKTKIPFVLEHLWGACYNSIEKTLLLNRGEQLQHECITFWNSWKTYWSQLFARNIEKLYEG